MWQLYKYQPLNQMAMDNLAQRKLWLSRPNAFNDPFELRLKRNGVKGLRNYRQKHPEFNGKDDDILIGNYTKELQDALDNMGVSCFTELRDNILMWSHYADSHKGICLGFCGQDESQKPGHVAIYPVKYSTEYPKADMAQTWHVDGSAKIIWTKHAGWSHEKEWRLTNVDGNKLVDYPGRLNEVIFGLRTTAEDRKLVQSILEDEKDLRFFKVVMDDNMYKLKIQPI